jgi:hypothetical protein
MSTGPLDSGVFDSGAFVEGGTLLTGGVELSDGDCVPDVAGGDEVSVVLLSHAVAARQRIRTTTSNSAILFIFIISSQK